MTHLSEGMFAKLSIKLIYYHYHFVRPIGLKIKMLQLEELRFGYTWLLPVFITMEKAKR